jgi:hypothetical protein
MPPKYDHRHWPILVYTEGPEPRTTESFQAHIDVLWRYISKGKSVHIVDTRQAPILNATERGMISAFAKAHAQKYPGHMQGMGLVASNKIQAGVMTAIIWLTRPKHETRAFTTMEEAMAWAQNIVDTRINPVSHRSAHF